MVLVAISLPMMFGMVGLVVDGGLLMSEHRGLQQIVDAAALVAADEISLGKSAADASSAATVCVQQHNGLADANVTVNIPPSAGAYAGNNRYAEVIVTLPITTHFMQIMRDDTSHMVRAEAVAGAEPATAGGVIAVLDPSPPQLTLGVVIPGLPLVTPHLGGLEVLGLGQFRVDGAVFVNNEWAGEDENGDPVGRSFGLRHATTCTPLLPLTKLKATDIRVTGGVDNHNYYAPFDAGAEQPLKANRRPVPDPLRDLPVPTFSADPANVVGVERGGVNVLTLPLLSPPVVLEPGVYEWIQVTSGKVTFNPGVYIIRNTHPVTGIALNVLAGKVVAEGVMFYFTDTANYSPGSGSPDNADGETAPPAPGVPTLLPTVLINNLLLGSKFSPLDDPGSPFHGMLFYQRRSMREPMIVVAEQLLGNADFSGTIYAKWGQLMFVGHGSYDLKFAVGNARIVNTLQCTFSPTDRFPPAEDVYLVQ